jgi:hypothetical protein
VRKRLAQDDVIGDALKVNAGTILEEFDSGFMLLLGATGHIGSRYL